MGNMDGLWLSIYQTGNLQWSENFTEDFIKGSMDFYTDEKGSFYIGGINQSYNIGIITGFPSGLIGLFIFRRKEIC